MTGVAYMVSARGCPGWRCDPNASREHIVVGTSPANSQAMTRLTYGLRVICPICAAIFTRPHMRPG